MSDASKSCAKCGTSLPADSPLDNCPRCLAGGILAPEAAGNASAAEVTTSAPTGPLEQVGERIGRYKLLEKIGEGGCGVVYVAEQSEPVRRRVALKVIKLGMDTRAVVARFEAERQALAMMDHPNIAKVFDGGTTATGRPFFVMELVRGARITQYSDENRLSTTQRLDLFIQVCHAVQHAHQKGIIHRDLKPSNILVTINDGVPVPKVIDFGVAKAASGQALTDKTVYTAFEQFIGTPAYMSPEQTLLTSLDIDTRSDIYSLGVLLYELLTGGLPFDPQQLLASGIDEIRRTIREQEPPRPSVRLSTLGAGELTTAAKRRSTDVTRLVQDVRGDLDWIVTKCLEKDRNRRYETANGLAADVQRHSKNEPIVARPPSRLYQFQKLARRNRTALAAAAAVFVALLAGLTFSTWAFVRERAARQEAAVEAAKSERVSKFLKNMLWSMKPSVAMGRDTALLREFAENAAERLARDLSGQPEVELELRATLGSVFNTIGDVQRAEAMHRETLPKMKALLGPNHPKLGPLLLDFASALCDRDKAVEAEALAREALALARRRRGPEHGDVTDSLAIVAWSLGRQKRYDEAEAMQRECLELTRRRRGPEHRDVAAHMADLASILGARNPQEAEALYRETLAMSKRLLKPSHPTIITVTKNFAQFYVKQKNLAQAEVLLRELLALQRNMLGNENRQVANTLATLAAALIDNGKPAEGEKIARESLALHRRLYGEETLEVSAAMNDLGIALWRLKKFDEAEALLREALATDRKLLPPDSIRLGRTIHNLANLLEDADKMAEAETLSRERLDRARLKPDPDPMDLESRIYDLAYRVYAQKKYAQAEALYRELIQRRSSRLPATDDDVIEPKASLGRLLADWAWMERTNAPAAARALERAREGEQLLRECLAVRLQGTNAGHWRVSDVRSRLGGAMLSVAVTDPKLAGEIRQARFAEIETLLLKGHEGIMPRNSPGRTRKRGTFERLIQLYEAWSKPAQAAAWRAKLAAFDQSKKGEPTPQDTANSAP